MLDLNPVFEFSRNHCVTICSFLVPANLLATTSSLLLLLLQRPIVQIRLAASLACLLAFTLFLHVGTWFIIGVVMMPTFILMILGTTCLLINIGVVTFPHKFRKVLQIIKIFVRQTLYYPSQSGYEDTF
jgi:hypothetical protein